MGKLTAVNILPGLLNTDREAGTAGRWKDGDHVRFWRGAPEKLGGWNTTKPSVLCRASAAVGIGSRLLYRFGLGAHVLP